MLANIPDEDAALLRRVLWRAFLDAPESGAELSDAKVYSRLDDYFDGVPFSLGYIR